ncbi:unnamed protein product [Symbiodinium microadriaticum]|nr:unnamed protein product [Symbiodinium microadriaticum]CAE7290947.1 unnamed protein product [Symbiodinium sp. KB8]
MEDAHGIYNGYICRSAKTQSSRFQQDGTGRMRDVRLVDAFRSLGLKLAYENRRRTIDVAKDSAIHEPGLFILFAASSPVDVNELTGEGAEAVGLNVATSMDVDEAAVNERSGWPAGRESLVGAVLLEHPRDRVFEATHVFASNLMAIATSMTVTGLIHQYSEEFEPDVALTKMKSGKQWPRTEYLNPSVSLPSIANMLLGWAAGTKQIWCICFDRDLAGPIDLVVKDKDTNVFHLIVPDMQATVAKLMQCCRDKKAAVSVQQADGVPEASDDRVGSEHMPARQDSQGDVPDTVPFRVMLTGQDREKDDMEVALEELMIEEDDNKRTCAGQEKKIDARVVEGDRHMRVHKGFLFVYDDDGCFMPFGGIPPGPPQTEDLKHLRMLTRMFSLLVEWCETEDRRSSTGKFLRHYPDHEKDGIFEGDPSLNKFLSTSQVQEEDGLGNLLAAGQDSADEREEKDNEWVNLRNYMTAYMLAKEMDVMTYHEFKKMTFKPGEHPNLSKVAMWDQLKDKDVVRTGIIRHKSSKEKPGAYIPKMSFAKQHCDICPQPALDAVRMQFDEEHDIGLAKNMPTAAVVEV